MNDAADEQFSSAEPEFREISQDELKDILENHKQWLAAEDKVRLKHLRANLMFAQLQGRILCDAQLQAAILAGAQLHEVNLRNAQLQEAVFWGAKLQGALLDRAKLQKAFLRQAQLQNAELGSARLHGANLEEAQLQGADLGYAQLPGAKLKSAQLQGADLEKANFHQANLSGANFDGEPEWGLPAADLTDADLRDADLSDAQLSTVTGLRAEMLAGAVLTNAKLPEDVKKFDKLTHVAETSRNASTVFFGLLAASLYSWLTIATTTDVALITGTASSPLPIINTNIARSGFYLAAPLILIAVYFYFHLYLQRLWGDLASLPARFPDGEALDGKAYPWLLNGLVRAHFKNLELVQRPLTRFENFVSILLAWWVVPLTLVAFWLRFLPRHDWWGTALHVALIASSAWFGVYSYRLAVLTLRGEPMHSWREGFSELIKAARSSIAVLLVGCAILTLFSVWSVEAWYAPRDNLLTRSWFRTYADLTNDDVSTKPSGWTGREETAEVEIAQVKGADLEGRDLRNADATLAFLVNARLADADLSGARLIFADLRSANLYRADLRGADLGRADLRGADLRGANLFVANISGTNLEGANLSEARGVTQGRLIAACGDDKTQLPQGLTIRPCPSPSPPTGSSSELRPR